MFACAPSDMPIIDLDILCHHLTINYSFKPVTQRKRKEGEDKRANISDEVKKSKEVKGGQIYTKYQIPNFLVEV